MDSNEKFWCVVWSLVSLTIISIAVIVSLYNYGIQIKAFELGFQKETIIGTDYTEYQKVSQHLSHVGEVVTGS